MSRTNRELKHDPRLESVAQRALIVDEDAKDLAHHAALLAVLGFEVAKCWAYDEAIRLIERELFGLPLVPLMVVGPNDIEAKVRLFELGADDYVVEPFDQTEFLARIKSLAHRN